MHDMALAAAKLGRKATCKSYLAQKNTHDSAVAQYAGLISTLVQQQTVQVWKAPPKMPHRGHRRRNDDNATGHFNSPP